MAIKSFLEGLSEYISGLEPEKQERMASHLLRRAINEEYDLQTSYELFSQRGFNISSDRFSDLYTGIQQKELNSQRVKYLSRISKPTDDILYPSFTLQDRRYNFGVSYQVYDEIDDSYHEKFFFLETDTLMTRGQIEAAAYNALIGLYPANEENIENVSLRYGEINVRSIR